MAIYTKKGDRGQTSLLGGRHVWKSDQRVDAYGAVDEAIAAITMARSNSQSQKTRTALGRIEEELFLVAAELASLEPDRLLKKRITADHVRAMEWEIDVLLRENSLANDFVIPGPYLSSASLHLARTIVRRAEREAVKLSLEAGVRDEILKYLNRLSDFLFALAVFEEEREVVKQVLERVRPATGSPAGMADGCRERREKAVLDLERAKSILEAAESKAKEIGVPVVMAVVDSGGNLVSLHRMDDSLLASIELAVNKAYTAVAIRKETGELAGLAAPGGPLYGLDANCGGKFVVFGGGIPLWHDGKLAGAIGVSGGAPDEDMAVASAGVAAFENMLRGE